MRLSKAISLLAKGKKYRHSGIARILHWSYAPAVLASIWSGFYITKPDRSYGFSSMNSARKVHFISQYIIVFSYLARVLYGLKDKNYKQIIPTRKTLSDIPEFLKYELFLTTKKPKYPKYNPGQKGLFTMLALLILPQTITGLILYEPDRNQRAVTMAGGLNPLRNIHFLGALSLSFLVSGHIYLALTHGLKHLKSIFTGYE